MVLDANGGATITPNDLVIGAADNCGVALLTASQTSFGCVDAGTNNVVITATDDSGNSFTCTSVVTVIDNSTPTISCPFDIVVNAGNGQNGANVAYDQPTASDNCGTDLPPTSLAGYTYKGTHNGHTYFLSNTQETPEVAHANALAAGGHLATISDYAENVFVSNMIASQIWIGLTDRDQEGTFKWISNEPVSYTNWAPGEPNNAGNEDWAVIN